MGGIGGGADLTFFDYMFNSEHDAIPSRLLVRLLCLENDNKCSNDFRYAT
jgi:hypothetical protein